MPEYQNPVAELHSMDSGILVTPENVRVNHSEAKFYCPDVECIDPSRQLILKVSKNNNPFFSHSSGLSHNMHPETLLHKSAIKWFATQKHLILPVGKNPLNFDSSNQIDLNPELTKLEYRFLNKIIPDVIVTSLSGHQIAIEIVVTNNLNSEKRKIVADFKLATIRIDLSQFYKNNLRQCQTDLHFVKCNLDNLLLPADLKTWINLDNPGIYHPFKNRDLTILTKASPRAVHDNSGCILIFSLLLFSFFCLMSVIISLTK
jgi:hypothetical protein